MLQTKSIKLFIDSERRQKSCRGIDFGTGGRRCAFEVPTTDGDARDSWLLFRAVDNKSKFYYRPAPLSVQQARRAVIYFEPRIYLRKGSDPHYSREVLLNSSVKNPELGIVLAVFTSGFLLNAGSVHARSA
ncbi:hypothetical protein EVAR_40420_1 [Eumeta japonica]|uniref:Uncharacterized protein n=1 Tax=Eumeta variegata TaxID=151549 RepID=A0A4C1W9C5_EUMVA|nr:hypothetical protein EVAR_40420_1 [Eumeta japonica]